MSRYDELKDMAELNEEEQTELDALELAMNPDKAADMDDFDSAFDEALDGKPQGEPELDEEGNVKKDSDDSTTEPEGDEPEDEDLIVQPVVEDLDTDTDEIDWEARAKASEQKMSSWEGRISKSNERAKEAERKLEEATKKSTSDKDDTSPEGDDSDDAAEAINEFTTEYPSLEKPIKAIATKMAEKIVKAELTKLQPQLDELGSRAAKEDEVVSEDHFSDIREAHPDYEEIRDSGKLKVWIEKQPSFVQYGFETVIKSGTADEIIDMFDRYKGKASQSSQTQQQKAKAKAKAHIAVDGESGGPRIPKDKKSKDDFDGAWDEAVQKK
jgi:hypothetical protein